MTQGIDLDQSIIITGGGTWGSAIAYQLAKRGYKNITVLDGNEFPSAISAGNDLNKILEEPESLPSDTDDDISYAWHTIEALATAIWRHDPVYKQHYHETGFIYAAVSDEAHAKVVEAVKGHENLYSPLTDAESFRRTMPEGVLTGELPGWRGFWREKGAGWVAARKTMEAVREAAISMGVKFIMGADGAAVEFLHDGFSRVDSRSRLKVASGIIYTANRFILTAGANSDRLLDFKKQLRPTAWTLAHVPLTEAEATLYRDLPVLYGVDRGFFMEPNVGERELKICDEHPGYLNFVHDELRGEMRSVPFSKEQIPVESEARIRALLRETMPLLADRLFSYARICWDADTVDRLFLLGQHPEYKNVTVAVGGSGHGFMCSPGIGILVSDLLESKLEERLVRALGWRPETAVNRDWWDTQNRFGVVKEVQDLQNVSEWTDIR